MASVIGVALICAGYSIFILKYQTPPAYEKLVEALVGASSDNSQLVNEQLAAIEKTNQPLATQISKVVQVFQERSAINAGSRRLSTERAKLLVRSLESLTLAPNGLHTHYDGKVWRKRICYTAKVHKN